MPEIQIKTNYSPFRLPGRRYLNRAAVAVIVALRPAPHILMLKRCTRRGDPWSAHMAFPGGRFDRSDLSLRHTAARELEEETGVQLKADDLSACIRLSDLITRSHNHFYPMVVTPYVWTLQERPEVALNHEAEAYFWVPLSLFTKENRRVLWWRGNTLSPAPIVGLPMPYYFHGSERIWGLSLRMIDELKRTTLIHRPHP